uniref:Uncharacterized protein n=1 Tax=Rhizophora mucronata TaxID=61149 RepID=A0A2P2PNB2_RHIMU
MANYLTLTLRRTDICKHILMS